MNKAAVKKLIMRTAEIAAAACLMLAAWTAPASALNGEPPQSGDADDFSFLYFGDIQITEDAQTDYAAWGELARGAVERAPGAAFALQGGDIVESGINREQWDAFLAAADAALGELPFFPTIGNHESNFISGKPELFLELFELPENGPEGFKEEFYSFDYAGVHVLVLNSWVFSGEQKLTEKDLDRVDGWIAADLAKSSARFNVAVTHIPVYAIHSDVTSNRMNPHWAPIFEEYGLDLCFVGHQHVYSRLKPLTDWEEDLDDGVTYIMGNSGLKAYSSADETLAERTVYNIPNYQLCTVDADSLTVQTFDADGNELDYVRLSPREKKLTRIQFVSALWKGEGMPEAGDLSPFVDVDETQGSEGAIAWAYEAGLILGYGDGRFGPEDIVKREHAALILERMEEYVRSGE
jgi:hypothetical protein